MKKLKLSLEDLKVESFETHPNNFSKGTVVGNTGSCPIPICWSPNCNTRPDDGCTWDCRNETSDITCVDECPETTHCGGGGDGNPATQACTMQSTCPNTCGDDD